MQTQRTETMARTQNKRRKLIPARLESDEAVEHGSRERYLEARAQVDGERQAKIALLKAQIADGSYAPDLTRLAETILLEASLGKRR